VTGALAVDRGQALAFRLAGQHLHRRTDALTAIAACGLQEYPPGWAAVALHARSEGTLGDVAGEVVTVNAMRGAPYVVPRADAAVFTLALVPDDDEQLKGLVGSGPAKEVVEAGHSVRGALDLVADAARDGLRDGPLGRDAFHQALRERLPDTLLPWCRGCGSHHVRPGLWRALGPLGVTVMPAKAVWGLAAAPEMPVAEARDELVRRFLRCFGPATHTQLASWAQTAPAHAKALFAALGDELQPVTSEGRKAFVLAEDADRLASPPAAAGVRVLGGHDPFVQQPDRDALTGGDVGVRSRLFPAVGRPGLVLSGGTPAGLWRGRKKGDVLEVELDWLGPQADVEAELGAVAKLRDCASARVL
jgi:AcrR family transcriptional regulator